ncbi:hypothetical protein [Cupriavidus necator]
MSIELTQFVIGDNNYIAKHNNNNAVIKAAVDALQAATQGGASSAATAVTAFEGMFGTVALIGYGSYATSTSGSNLTLQPGYTWRNSFSKVLQMVSAATLSFSGKSAATYYIEVDAGGQPNVVTTSVEPIYSVAWTGSAFGTITRLAAVFPTALDFHTALNSTAMGATYQSLDALLEAIAAAALAGAKPYVPEIKSVTYAGTITADFSDADVIRITLGGNPTITLAGAADGQKCVLELKQDATGGRTVTWSADVRYGTDLPSITLSTAGGALDRIGLIYNAAAAKYDVVALSRGF